MSDLFTIPEGSTTVTIDDDLDISSTANVELDVETQESITITGPPTDWAGDLGQLRGLEQTVVCHHCGEANHVQNGHLLPSFQTDSQCRACGYPLRIVR